MFSVLITGYGLQWDPGNARYPDAHPYQHADNHCHTYHHPNAYCYPYQHADGHCPTYHYPKTYNYAIARPVPDYTG